MKINTVAKKDREDNGSFGIPANVIDSVTRVFPIFVGLTVLLAGYLIYGLLTGQLATAAHSTHTERLHALTVVQQFSSYLNISMIITLIMSVILFLDQEAVAWLLLTLAALLAFGLNIGLDYVSANAKQLTSGVVADATMHELQNSAIMIAVAGGIILLRNLWARVMEARSGVDLTAIKLGGDVKKENTPRALIGASAKCWQLPYCREQLRPNCPIYLGRTKCWKQGVGCMCEEQIMLVAMTGITEHSKPTLGGSPSGFIPISDLAVEQNIKDKAKIATRPGPRGSRIPIGKPLTKKQRVQRCHNCIIFNDHQLQKYNLFSPLVTISIPLFFVLNFSTAQSWLTSFLHGVDSFVAHIQFTGGSAGTSMITTDITGSILIEGILIFCMMLIILSFALRALEYVFLTLKL